MLNRTHVYKFIKAYMKINKTNLAKKMHVCKTALAPSRLFPKELYENVFKVEYEEKETDRLGSLKYFLEKEGLKEALSDMWEREYESFIKELLSRADVPPPEKEKPERKKDNHDANNISTCVSESNIPHNMTILNQPIFSEETLGLLKEKVDLYKPNKIFDTVHSDLIRPITLVPTNNKDVGKE